MSLNIYLAQIRHIPRSRAPSFADNLEPIWAETGQVPTMEANGLVTVISQGCIDYWPLNNLENPGELQVLAYGPTRQLLGQKVLKLGDQRLVSIHIERSEWLVFLDGQQGRHTRTRSILHEAAQDTHQYFWIINSHSGAALTWDSASPAVSLEPLAASSQQIWVVDNIGAIFTGRENRRLSAAQSASGTSSIRLMESDEGGNDQWNIDRQGSIRSFSNDLAWTQTGERVVELTEYAMSPTERQQWFFKPYMVSPFTRENQLAQLLPEQHFFLGSNKHTGSRLVFNASQAQLVSVEDAQEQDGAWRYEQEKLIDVATGLALTTKSDSIVLAAPDPENSHQNWYMSSDGYLIQPLSGKVLEFEDGRIQLMDYDTLRAERLHWRIRHIRQRRAINAVFQRRQLGYISKLSVTVTVANVFWAGTSDKIMMTLTSLDKAVRLFDAPSAGDSVTIDIDIQAMFGKPRIPMRDVHTILFYQESRAESGGNDQWKLESIVLKANDRYLNDSLRSINRWVSPPYRSAHISWGSTISWCNWRDIRYNRHIDFNGQTYPVTLMPYIGDLKAWRNYDPSSIDGVGQLIGMNNGRLIGEILKTRDCEALKPNDSNNSYTWVFTPEGSIIYRLWNHEDSADYVRHSQLGNGRPVICAGEFRIERRADVDGVVDVIAMVNDASGHYKPDGGACLGSVEEKFKALGIPTDHIKWSYKGQ
ncbi:hypothetical protein AWM79_10645 [Pseudomonas agarici]|uniref:Ricin B lectin domain-containing protein n=1 Tax=Pseudomonas agarici TaxID=46677 RepID=A0A0X1T113_PSEAA|nr:hypothetical protein [Pseudomonas agarici]AMB85732.1 hypothetical protein AWM79_10645 [Pseudomonas agarici]